MIINSLFPKLSALLLFAFLTWNCSSTERYTSRQSAKSSSKNSVPSSTKKSEAISVKKYFDNIGEASFYHDKFENRITTSGEVFYQDSLTGAHLTLAFGTKVKVTNLKNNKSVIVKINDRPPADFKRLIDLSYRAAKELDMIKDGITAVRIEVIK